jgi:hypothetical protein
MDRSAAALPPRFENTDTPFTASDSVLINDLYTLLEKTATWHQSFSENPTK